MYITDITETYSQANSQSNNVVDNHTVLATDSAQLVDTNPSNLEVGSVIQYGPQYGVIKWIGKLPDQTEINAGLEMVRHGGMTIMHFIMGT